MDNENQESNNETQDINDENQNNNDVQERRDSLNQNLLPPRKGFLGSVLEKIAGKGKKSGTFMKAFSTVWKMIPIHIKIIIVVVLIMIIIIAAAVLALEIESGEASVRLSSVGVEALNINENSDEVSKQAKKLYDEYDSYLGFTTEQLNQMYQVFKDDTDTDSELLRASGKMVLGDNASDEPTIKFSLDYKRELYEHILRTEKYNFNAIEWKEVGHNSPERAMTKEAKSELELMVPSGISQEDLLKVMELTSPYLLTNDIPRGLLAGMIFNSSTNSISDVPGVAEKFVYQTIKEALTKLSVTKYNVQTKTVNTSQEDKVVTNYNYQIKLERDNNGNYVVASVSEPVQVGEPQSYSYDEVANSSSESTEVYWYVTDAKTYDCEAINEFEFKSYSDDDVNNLKNPDSNNLVNTTKENVVSHRYKVGDVYETNGQYIDLSSTITASYTVEDKTIRYYTKEWKDKVTPKKSSTTLYSYEDLLEYNTTQETVYVNMKTDKSIVTVDDFESDSKAKELYERYEGEDLTNDLYGLSLIDFFNANPGIYNKYLESSTMAYSKYNGIDRYTMQGGYNQIKTILDNLATKIKNEGEVADSSANLSFSTGDDEKKKVPFVYGSTLGYEVTTISYTSGVSGNYLSGLSLLKAYLHGNEGNTGMTDENGNRVTDDESAKYYIVGLVGGNRTVGYGIDLETSGKEEQIKAATGMTTINVGDKVDKEVVDKAEDEMIQAAIENVKSYFGDQDLKEYQIHALVSRYYNCGSSGYKSPKEASGTGKDLLTSYKDYWNEENDDKYEELYEKYKDNQTARSSITAEVDFNNLFYVNYMQYPNSGSGLSLVNRRRSEFILFSTGYYDTLQRFWTNAATPGGIELYDSSNKVIPEKLYELQSWFEENFFDGTITSAKSLGYDSTPVQISTAKSHLRDPIFQISVLEPFQCTWWANCRASWYLNQMDPEKFPRGLDYAKGNGGVVATNLSSHFGVTLYRNARDIKPNAVVSFTGTNGYGHVAYVEAVDSEGYYISEASGWLESETHNKWNGIRKVSFDDPDFYGFVLMDDILNSK